MVDVRLGVQDTGIVPGQGLAHLDTSLVLVAQDLDALAHCNAVAVVVVGLQAVGGGRRTGVHQRRLSLLFFHVIPLCVLG